MTYDFTPATKELKLIKHADSFYRLCSDTHFANIRKGRKYSDEQSSKWYADIRTTNGNLVRYAGIWNTRKDAIEEATWLLERE